MLLKKKIFWLCNNDIKLIFLRINDEYSQPFQTLKKGL